MTFKRTILKTLAVTTVVGAVMAMSSVVAMAAAETITDKATLTFSADDATTHGTAKEQDTTVTMGQYFDVNFVATKSTIAKLNKPVTGVKDHSIYAAEFKPGGNSATISFATDKPGVVIIGGRSSNKETAADVDVVDSSGTVMGTYEGALNGDETLTISTPIYLPKADTYTIKHDTVTNRNLNIFMITVDLTAGKAEADSTAAIKANDGKYYAIGVVSSKTAQTATKLNLGTDSTQVVYNSVQLGKNNFKAEDIGGSAGDFVYATEITLSGNDYANKTSGDIQSKITVGTE